jgi:anti-sigma factor (TIGR02949 family)
MVEGGDRTKQSFQRLAAAELAGLYWLARQLVREGAEDLVQEGDDQMSDSQRLIPCSDAVWQLWEYLDHAVSPQDQEKIDRHLSFCRRCCGDLEFATGLRQLLASQGAEELPPHVKARLQRFMTGL